MKKRKFQIILSTIAVIAMIFGMGTASEAGLSTRPVSSNKDGDFQVDFKPVKQTFEVGERIRFKVKGNKTFYLYLFSIDTAANRGTVLLPNARQQYIKYQAGKEYIVPEKNIEFFSDRAGREKIIMLASTRKMNINFKGYSKSGNFFTAAATEVEEESKALHIRSKKKKAQQVTCELNLSIVDPDHGTGIATEESSATATTSRVSAFISSDRTRYIPGDTITITYGADNKGYVHLYVVTPDGGYSFLKTRKVSGDKFYQEKARAALPGGEHQLIAIYDQNPTAPKDGPGSLLTGEKGKDINLIGNQPETYAIYYLNVQSRR